jgi:hypothetical protein
MLQDDRVLIEENADHGFIVTVSGAELGDLFDDFLVEHCDCEGPISFGPNSMAFHLGKGISRADVEQIIQAFSLSVAGRT